MENTKHKRSYETITKAVSYLLKWAVRAIYVLLALCLAGIIALLIIPKNLMNFDLANIEHINIYLFNVLSQIENPQLIGVINLKWILILLLVVGLLHLAFLQFILYKLRDVVRDVSEKHPFSAENVTRMQHIGFAYVGASVLFPILGSWLFTAAAHLVDLFQATIHFSINFQSLFMGIVILILSYVFDYGRNLQEDYDMTV